MNEKFLDAIKDYHPRFKETMLKTMELAEQHGHPTRYWADVGSIVINDIYIDNGIGDGWGDVSVIYSNEPDYEEQQKGYTDTGLFFYAGTPIRIRLYDCCPESEFTLQLKRFACARVLRDDNGNFLIACHVL